MSAAANLEPAAATPGEAYWSALAGGRLTFQRCGPCGNAWLPPRTECPRCWSTEWQWAEASGDGHVISWVVYHVAFDKRFQDRLPYNVAVVELAEGPRLVSNLVEMPADGEEMIGRRVTLVIQQDFDRPLPRFRMSEGKNT